ncbi:MAG: ABC transporter substrate-binding protein [Hydrogenibacillus sp.]|nr:ABC transporter substrate-binding protein [Hydrogenibacillus sp.]
MLAACGAQEDAKSSTSASNGDSKTHATGGDAASDSSSGSAQPGADVKKIGIMQIISHPALDNARQGFIDALKDAGYVDGNTVKYDVQNAEGSQDTAKQIAYKFVSDRVDLILAIATSTAQAVAETTQDIPIVITAVTDPVSAGLVQSLERPGRNITGTTDMNPIEEQLALVKALTAGNRVGILYNSGEANSLVQVDIAKEAAKKLDLELILRGITNTSEVKQAAESLVGKIDAFYIPTDNTVVSALRSVVDVAESAKLPIVAGEGDSVKEGAIITYGIDYYKLGYQTGEMAVKILRGEAEPKDMPIERQKELKLYINVTEAKKIGIDIPKDLLDRADVTY